MHDGSKKERKKKKEKQKQKLRVENRKRKSPAEAWKTAVSTTAANADDKTHSAAFLQFMLVQSTNPVDECSK